MRVSSYSDYLQHVCALIGVDQNDLQTTELTFLNTFFNKALRDIWERNSWTDLCPYGEVRFPVNLIPYPNDLTQTNWAITNATATSSSTNNPLDNRVTASRVMETTSTGNHGFSQTFQAIPNASYQAQGYFRGIGGDGYIQVSLTDGVTTYSATYSGVSGAIVTSTGSGVTTGIQLQGNGFYYWSISGSSVTGAASGQLTVLMSPNGSSFSYAGNVNNGIYAWGNTVSTPNSYIPAAFYIPWEQAGESSFDVVYEAWTSDPGSFLPPFRADYNLTTQGLELIGPTTVGPVYMYYRYRRPSFGGGTWSSALAYTSSITIQFTSASALTCGQINYWTATTNTTAGQSPDTTPSVWSKLNIPYVFFTYIVYSAYADWLLTEGQAAKAQAMLGQAQMYLDNENDRLERQQGDIQPWKVYTHLTSQNRGLGYVGQNFNAGTATIN